MEEEQAQHELAKQALEKDLNEMNYYEWKKQEESVCFFSILFFIIHLLSFSTFSVSYETSSTKIRS